MEEFQLIRKKDKGKEKYVYISLLIVGKMFISMILFSFFLFFFFFFFQLDLYTVSQQIGDKSK